MNTLIIVLIAFAFVSVNCDKKSDLKELIQKLTKIYESFTEQEIHMCVVGNVEAVGAIIRSSELGLRLQGLEFIVDVYENQTKHMEVDVPEVWKIIEGEEDAKIRHEDAVIFGVFIAMTVEILEITANLTANQTVNVTDSVDHLHKKFIELKDNALSSLAMAVKQLDAYPGAKYWVQTVQKHAIWVYEDFDDKYKTFSDEVKAKSLQLLINVLEFIDILE